MKEFKLILIFAAAIIADGIIMPALFGFNNSLFSFIAAILPLLYFSPELRLVFLGLIFILGLEIYSGFAIASLSLPFLITAVIVYIAQNFFEVKYDYYNRFSPVQMATTSALTVGALYLFSVLATRSWLGGFTAGIYAIILLETAIMIILFGFVFNKSNFNVR